MSDVNTEEKKNDNNDEEQVTDKQTDEHTEELQQDEPPQQEKRSQETASGSQTKQKVDVLLKPAGNAPIMKKKKWAVDRSKRISWVSEFISKYIKLGPSESLFLYVNQSFSPSPDTECGVLFDSFGSDGKLVLHYCRTQAWG